jgi:hypothetical protein
MIGALVRQWAAGKNGRKVDLLSSVLGYQFRVREVTAISPVSGWAKQQTELQLSSCQTHECGFRQGL